MPPDLRTGEALALVALGANLGDRDAQLSAARTAIGGLPGTRLLAASSVEETVPLGGLDQPPYRNQMLAVATSLRPHALLDALQDLEHRAGRIRAERWASRTLDCDIVRFGDTVLHDDRLTVPHPELPNRVFWQRAIEQLQPVLDAGVAA